MSSSWVLDGVDLVLGLEDVLHHAQTLVGQEVGRLTGDHLDAALAALLDGVGEALGA
jgi:hypothetical protein